MSCLVWLFCFVLFFVLFCFVLLAGGGLVVESTLARVAQYVIGVQNSLKACLCVSPLLLRGASLHVRVVLHCKPPECCLWCVPQENTDSPTGTRLIIKQQERQQIAI